MKKDKKILIYDGTCNVCTAARNAIEKRDSEEQFELVDMHSERGQQLQESHNIDANESAYLIEDGIARGKSDMITGVLNELGWFERFVARIVKLLPKKAADNVYSFLAKYRYLFNR